MNSENIFLRYRLLAMREFLEHFFSHLCLFVGGGGDVGGGGGGEGML